LKERRWRNFTNLTTFARDGSSDEFWDAGGQISYVFTAGFILEHHIKTSPVGVNSDIEMNVLNNLLEII